MTRRGATSRRPTTLVVDRRRPGRPRRRRALAARAGLATVLFDENPGVGGQIYRGITIDAGHQPRAFWARTTGRARSSRPRPRRAAPTIVQRRHGLEPRSAARLVGVSIARRGAPDRGQARHHRHRLAGAAVSDSRLDLARRDDGRRRADARSRRRASCPPAARSWRAPGRCSGCWRRSSCAPAGRIEAHPRHHAARQLAARAAPPAGLRAVALLRQGPGAAARGAGQGAGHRASTSFAADGKDRLAEVVFAHRRRRAPDAGRPAAAAPGRGAQRQSRHGRRRRASLERRASSASSRCSTRISTAPCPASPSPATARASPAARRRPSAGRIAAHRRRAARSSPKRRVPDRAEPCARPAARGDGPRLPRLAVPARRRSSACPRATPSSAAARR